MAVGLLVIAVINGAALAVTFRAVVFHSRSMTLSLVMTSNEGVAASYGFPGGSRSWDQGDIFDPAKPENVLDPGASAWQQEPWTTKAHAEIGAGRAPLWSANVGLGMPLFAAAQGGFSNPFNWPLLLRPTTGMWDVTLLSRLLIGGILMSIFAWYLGMRPWIASVAGVVFMLSGQFVGRFNNVETSVSMFLPLVLLGIEMCIRRPSRTAITVTAGGVALTILAGMPEQSFVCLLVAALYAVARLGVVANTTRAWRPVLLRIGAGAAGLVVGVGLSLPLILPFLEYVSNSNGVHGAAGSSAAAVANDWHTLPQVLAPRWVWTQSTQWFGIAASVLALLGIRARVLPRAVGLTLLGVALVFTAQIYGVPQWFHDFISGIPLIDRIYTFRYLGAGVSAAVALLAGAALQRMVDRSPGIAWWELGIAAALIAVGLYSLGALQAAAIQVRDNHASIVAAGVALLVLVVGLVAVTRVHRLRIVATAALAAATVAEMVAISSPIAPLPPRVALFPPTPQSTFLDASAPSGQGRTMSTVHAMFPSVQDAYDYDSPLLIDALYPERSFRYLKLWVLPDLPNLFTWDQPKRIAVYSNPFLDAANLTYVTSRGPLDDRNGPPPPGQLEYVTTTADGVRIDRNTHGMGRANVYFDVARASTEDGAQALMTAPGYDPRRTAVVEGGGTPPATGAPIPATVTSYDDSRAVIDVNTPRAGLLVVSDAWFPGWVGTLDGHPVPILPADLAMRGVDVPAGRHTVVMSYEPSSWRHGLEGAAITLLAFVVGMFAVPPLIRRVRRRRVEKLTQ